MARNPNPVERYFAKEYFYSALTSIGVIGSSADRPLPAGSRGLQSHA